MLPAMTKRTSHAEVPYLRPGEAARALSLHTRTLTRMAEKGQIQSITLPSGHRRYLAADVSKLIDERRTA